jgi:hypothetical protein
MGFRVADMGRGSLVKMAIFWPTQSGGKRTSNRIPKKYKGVKKPHGNGELKDAH